MKNLSATEFSRLLVKLDACKDATEWAKGKSLAEVWSTCHRGDWMLWLAARYGNISTKVLVTIACDCAESVLCNVPKEETRPAECIATVRRWLADNATIAEVRSAAESAESAQLASWSAESVSWSARSALWSARSAWSASWSVSWSAESAAESAWSASWSAAESAARSAAESAESASLQFSADLCRKYITVVE